MPVNSRESAVEPNARAEQGGAHALARFAHAGLGQSDNLGGRQAAREVHFHPHQRGIDPGAGTAVDQRQAHVWFPAEGCLMVRQAFRMGYRELLVKRLGGFRQTVGACLPPLRKQDSAIK